MKKKVEIQSPTTSYYNAPSLRTGNTNWGERTDGERRTLNNASCNLRQNRGCLSQNQQKIKTISDNWGKWETGTKCSIEFAHFWIQNTWKTNDFVDYFRNFTFLLKLPLKLLISWLSFLSDGPGRSGRSGVFESENSPKIARESIILTPDLRVRF